MCLLKVFAGILKEVSTVKTQSEGLLDYVFSGKVVEPVVFKGFSRHAGLQPRVLQTSAGPPGEVGDHREN